MSHALRRPVPRSIAALAFVSTVGCAGMLRDDSDAGVPPTDAAHARDAAADDGGADSGPRPADGGLDAGRDAGPRLGPCGDVMPADHPPFDAIRRLATTGEEVRILVYGQSISEQDWWIEVRDWLRETYPDGNLVMEEHARGGCSSQCLVGRDPWFLDRRTENRLPGDVFAWNPDLVLFHVYGRHDDYETIVRAFGEGCRAFDDHPSATARCRADQTFPSYAAPELLLQTDHRTPSNYPNADGVWERMMSEEYIPMYADRYGARIADVWHEWADHLARTNTPPAALLSDAVHLNAAGNQLMASLIKPHLCYRPIE